MESNAGVLGLLQTLYPSVRFRPAPLSHLKPQTEPLLLRLAYGVAQVCNADARDHRRVAKDDRRADEAVEKSNSGAKNDRSDVDADFVEEPSIQQLLDGVGAVDPNGLSRGRGLGLVHRAFDTVGH